MQVCDIHGFGSDPDLASLPADAPVTVEMIDVDPCAAEFVWSMDQVAHFTKIYSTHGPWALPPVVCVGVADWQIAGAHRMLAAREAGLRQVPAFIVHV